jgi:hypothetical protein
MVVRGDYLMEEACQGQPARNVSESIEVLTV